ncbi:MAG: CRISPR-associated nuclease/helicase Cas3 [Candidatus Argoarchaeum ethanivorans]|uniref:CRISPR-associated nuclease/helicase Cas3 n=1 Tax=Candidatus Argoarchaeum ethanivorans TaxID=2608793 RepID=A0A811TAE2_9EURY|nr:MAG: CRISPR-associated nuclease/helicase Cas3 [Candidatus Argoarchaeum ethanivorans]
MSPSELIAKKRDDGIFQTFEGHITDSLLILKDYFIKNREVLKEFSKNFGLERNSLYNLLFLSVYLHDIGKLTEEFQQNIKAGKPCASVSHAFFALPFIESDFQEDEMNNLLKLTILSHHSQLYNQIFENAKLKNKVTYIKYEIKRHIGKSELIYEEHFSDIFSLENKAIYSEWEYLSHFNMRRKIQRNELERLKRGYQKNTRTKAVYCLVLAVLKHCDQKASGYFDKAKLGQKSIHGSVIDQKALDGINYSLKLFKSSERFLLDQYEPYEYQKHAMEIDYCGIISAPCGRGKTEASLLAASRILESHKKNRIIFALPTQITSNAMYERLKKIFGDGNVGIYHGMSRFIHGGEGTWSETEDEDIKTLVYDEKVFAKPVIVTTIDHLIYSLVHGYKQSDFALGNILNSVIIFDEIHYYETYTLRYILDCFEILKELHIPHIAMSGTLLEFIINRLGKTEYKLIEDQEGMDFEPFIIQREQHSIFNALDRIEQLYDSNKNQIIILNTVKRAKDMYRRLKTKVSDILLLHSQFTFEDRWKKEAAIQELDGKRPWILVSTQAIEISVDISCDVMHTELAPIDAIGQRGGRLNRKGRTHKNEHIMYLYEPENHKPYYFDGKNVDIEDFVEKTDKVIGNTPISYRLIKSLCNAVYTDVKLRKTNLEGVFEDCILFGKTPWEIRGIQEEGGGNLIKLRDESYPTIDVIPDGYWDQIKDAPKKIEKYKVKIPFWWYSKFYEMFRPEEGKYEKYIICRIPYTTEYGFDMDKEPEHTMVF